jgi:hypothetical protein
MGKIYLVGIVWYSADQGDYPNTDNFPQVVFANLEEALEKYEELAKDDRKWGFGWQEAYLAEAEFGKEIKALRGSLRA